LLVKDGRNEEILYWFVSKETVDSNKNQYTKENIIRQYFLTKVVRYEYNVTAFKK
jgi:hypothetical protein